MRAAGYGSSAIVLSLCAVLWAGTPVHPPFDSNFDAYWGDQKAELAAYDLIIPRYGQLRKGVAVTIFVTEPFSNSARVKAEAALHPPRDVFPVLKLNFVQDFPTGVYDYNVMSSVFVAMRPVNGLPAGSPTKVSFSSQEWCGHVYHQLLFDSEAVWSERHSYFGGEGDATRSLDHPKDGISEDTLMFWARGLAQPFMAPGETRGVPLLRSVKLVRLNHVPLVWQNAVLTRHEEIQRVTVPAGTFEVETRTVMTDDARSWRFYVEQAHPHRLIKWTASDGEQAELLGSERMTYWKMNQEGMEQALTKLGLSPRPPRIP